MFLYHLGSSGEIGWRPLRAFTTGQAGVSFFFVLSGFVLVWSFRADPSAWRFYRRRFARIYPATLATVIVAAVLIPRGWLGLHYPPYDFTTGTLGAVASLCLIQAWFRGNTVYPVYSYNPVAWTLSCEAFFYALLPLLVAGAGRARTRTVLLAAGASSIAGLAATIWFVHAGQSYLALNNPVIRLPEFLLGVGLGIAVVRGWVPTWPAWRALALLSIGAVVAHFRLGWAPIDDYFVLPGFVALLISAIGSDLRLRPGFLTRGASIYLGELSFCFYLVHFMVMHAVVAETGWGHAYSLGSGIFPAIVVFGCCLLAAAGLHHLVELPMQGLLRPARPGAARSRS